MSKYHIDTTKTITENGVTRKTNINKYVDIDFSAAQYNVKVQESVLGADYDDIELIPDNMDFLHEVTEIFPLNEFNIKIRQIAHKRDKVSIYLYLDICRKDTGEEANFDDEMIPSDKDYDYIRDVLKKKVPQHKWKSAEDYIKTDIEGTMRGSNWEDYFTDATIRILSRMVSARYKELKTDGYVNYNDEKIKNIARDVVENALKSYAQKDK